MRVGSAQRSACATCRRGHRASMTFGASCESRLTPWKAAGGESGSTPVQTRPPSPTCRTMRIRRYSSSRSSRRSLRRSLFGHGGVTTGSPHRWPPRHWVTASGRQLSWRVGVDGGRRGGHHPPPVRCFDAWLSAEGPRHFDGIPAGLASRRGRIVQSHRRAGALQVRASPPLRLYAFFSPMPL
jgi:hypothetical protein